MLVVVGVDAGVDFRAPSFGVLARVHGVGVQDAGKFDLELDGAVLVENPVDAVLVVGGSEDLGDDEFAGASDDDRVITEIGVFEQDAVVLFVDADGVLDRLGGAGPVDKFGVHVVDAAFAVTAQAQRVGHVAAAVFAQVERVLALMRVLRVAVWNHHLGERKSVEDWSKFVLDLVEIGDVAENNAFSVVETYVDGPVLPFNDTAIDLEAHAFWLGDVDGFDVGSVAAHLLDRLNGIIVGRGLANRSPNLGHIDVNDLLLVCVENRAKIQRIRILGVIDVRAIVHQRLLKSDGVAESLVVANGPGIAVDLVHLFRRNANQTTLLDDSGVFAHDVFDDLEVFHGDQRLDTWGLLPFDRFPLCEVDMAIKNLPLGGDNHNVSDPMRFRGVIRVSQPFYHLSLGRLIEGDGIIK